MRTYVLVTASILAMTLAIGTAAAEPQGSELNRLLKELGLLPTEQPVPINEDSSGSETESSDAKPRGSLVASVISAVAVPVALVGQAVSLLGLNLVSGLFQGMAEGAKTVAAAGSAVVANPGDSALVASIAIAAASLLSTLGYLAQKYGSLGAIPLYTRIAKSQLLENGVRQQIFELIKQNPGINVSEISRRLDIAWGTATHHLHKLRHEKLVGVRIASNQKCYFPNGGTYTPHEMDVMSAIKNPTARQIADFLVRHGPKCHGEVSELLGLTPALVSFHADKLVHAGVVARHRDGRRTIFTPLEMNLDPVPRAVAH